MSALYPLKFKTIFKEKIWGGEKIRTILKKDFAPLKNCGETWEISGVKDNVSEVANGPLSGKSLTDLIKEFKGELVGEKVYRDSAEEFPLLVKFIDANEDLSIQVHPGDELAKKRHQSLGKTEMWYVMQADTDSRIIVGFKENSSKEEYLKHLHDNTLVSILDGVKAKAGDVFFLETGTVHAIGAGLVVAEIQQTSDITYRLYDFDRVDAQGNKRELHVDLALDAINYNKVDTQKKYDTKANTSNVVVDCPYFTTNLIPLEGKVEVSKSGETFTVYMCIEGSFEIEYDGFKHTYIKGDTVLVPAAINAFNLNGKASILEI